MTLYDRLPSAMGTAHDEASRTGHRYRVEVWNFEGAVHAFSITRVNTPRRTNA